MALERVVDSLENPSPLVVDGRVPRQHAPLPVVVIVGIDLRLNAEAAELLYITTDELCSSPGRPFPLPDFERSIPD